MESNMPRDQVRATAPVTKPFLPDRNRNKIGDLSAGRDTNTTPRCMASIMALMQQEMQNLGKVVQNEMRDTRQMVQKEIQEMHQQIKSDHADLMSSLAKGPGPQRRESLSSVETTEFPPAKTTRMLSESIIPAGTGRSSVISLTTALERTTSTNTGLKALADNFPTWKDTILKLDLIWNQLGKKTPTAEPRFAVAKLDDSWLFHIFMSVVVVVNCACLAIEANLSVQKHGQTMPTGLWVANVLFLFAYTFELIVKLTRRGLAFFYGEHYAQNWLDVFLVVYSVVDILIFDVAESLVEFYSFRAFRFFRAAKILKMFRMVSVFSEARALAASLAAARRTLLSSGVVLFVILFMTSLLMVAGVAFHLSDIGGEAPLVEIDEALLNNFGSVWRACLSLLVCCFGGDDWIHYVRQLETMGLVYPTLLVMVVIFVQLVLLSVIMGIFVDKAMRCLSIGHHEVIRQHAIGELEKRSALEAVLKDAGLERCEPGDKITREEWYRMMKSPHLIAHLDFIGYPPDAANDMFHAFMDESSDETVDAGLLIKALCGMNRPASAFDIRRWG